MTLQELFGATLLAQVGPVARTRGFKRARRVWRRANDRGDWAAFEVQLSQWNSADRMDCIVNIGATPAPWLDFLQAADSDSVKSFRPSHGIFRSVIGPRERDGGDETWWSVTTPEVAEVTATEIAQRMIVDGFPLLEELLDRGRLVERIRSGQMGLFTEPNPMWLATVLAEDGPSEELDLALERAAARTSPDRLGALNGWCRRRADAGTQSS